MQPVFSMTANIPPSLAQVKLVGRDADMPIPPLSLAKDINEHSSTTNTTSAIEQSLRQSPSAIELVAAAGTPFQTGNGTTALSNEGYGNEAQQPRTETEKTLSRRASFWDYFRPPSTQPNATNGDSEQQHASTACIDKEASAAQAPDGTIVQEPAQIDGSAAENSETTIPASANAAAALPSEDSGEATAAADASTRALRRQSSRMSFTLNLAGWGRRGRRNTDASVMSQGEGGRVQPNADEDPPLTPSSTLPSKAARMPSRSHTSMPPADHDQTHADVAVLEHPIVSSPHLRHTGHQLAQDVVRFAHAAHTIKTTDDIDVLRSLAGELDTALRTQTSKFAGLHAQLEAMHWRLHDVHDENTHLRTQLGRLSEQIAQQHAQIEVLQTEAKHGKQDAEKMAVKDEVDEPPVDQTLNGNQATDEGGVLFSAGILSASLTKPPSFHAPPLSVA